MVVQGPAGPWYFVSLVCRAVRIGRWRTTFLYVFSRRTYYHMTVLTYLVKEKGLRQRMLPILCYAATVYRQLIAPTGRETKRETASVVWDLHSGWHFMTHCLNGV